MIFLMTAYLLVQGKASWPWWVAFALLTIGGFLGYLRQLALLSPTYY